MRWRQRTLQASLDGFLKDFKKVLESCGIQYENPSDVQYLRQNEQYEAPMERVYESIRLNCRSGPPQLILVILKDKTADTYRQVTYPRPSSRNNVFYRICNVFFRNPTYVPTLKDDKLC